MRCLNVAGRTGGWVLAALAAAGMLGCAQNELGRFSGYHKSIVKDPQRIRNPIVRSENYWIQREVVPEEQFPGPTPDDLRKPEQDYILGAGDLIDITVFELMVPGAPYLARQRISQSGQITFPYIGTVKSAGLATRGLEEKLADLLEPDYLTDPQVSVFVAEYRNLNVSVINGIARPGIYPMMKQEMTLLELVAMAGGVLQLVEDYGYVIREYAPEETDLLLLERGVAPPAAAPPEAAAGTPEAAAPPSPKPAAETADQVKGLLEKMAEGEIPDVRRIEAAEAAGRGAPKVAPPPAERRPPAEALAKDEKDLSRWIWSDGKWVEVKGAAPAAAEAAPAVPVPAVPAVPAEVAPAMPEAKVAVPVRLAEAPPEVPAEAGRLQLEQKLRRLGVVEGSGQLRRIIRFDVQSLLAGDPTQNVVLRDADVVTIPSPPIGDFYMAGEVARPGVYSLTGRKITLLQAVAAAGGLTAVAVPWRTEVVRRISEEEEEFIYVDLSKIARGEVPDFYLHPEDLIRVGTDQGALFNAVLRNAMRATYGLGAVYDMNFADFYPWTDRRNPIF